MSIWVCSEEFVTFMTNLRLVTHNIALVGVFMKTHLLF